MCEAPPLQTLPAGMGERLWWRCLSTSGRSWAQELWHPSSITLRRSPSWQGMEIQPSTWAPSSARPPTGPIYFLSPKNYPVALRKKACPWNLSLFPGFSPESHFSCPPPSQGCWYLCFPSSSIAPRLSSPHHAHHPPKGTSQTAN